MAERAKIPSRYELLDFLGSSLLNIFKGEILVSLTIFGYTKPMRQITTVRDDIQSGSKPGEGKFVGKYSLKNPVKAS